jgi:hypothetical protein
LTCISRRASGVVRLFDLRLASNRFVVGAFVVALIVAPAVRGLQGAGFAEASSAGTQLAFSIFLSWALARELDPDSPASANAALCAACLILPSGEPQLWPLTALLFAVRIVVRSTGCPPNLFDLVWLPVLAAQAARSAGGLIAASTLAFALAWDAQLPHPAQRRVMLSGLVAAVLAAAAAAVAGTLTPQIDAPTAGQWAVYAVVAVALLGLRTPPPRARADLTAEPISRERLIRGRWLVVAAGALTIMWLGGAGAPALVGVWAAVIGVAFNHGILARLRARRAASTE